jgi:hypothetical protein
LLKAVTGKITFILILLCLIGALSFVSLYGVLANDIDDSPEFYFTRLVYSDNRRGFLTTWPKPRVEWTCPEFGGGNFFPRQGNGWAIDYPAGDCKFMGGIARLSNIRVHPNPNATAIMDENLFQFPYLYAVSVGGMYISDREAARLREHLLRGGFLHVDDFWGLRQLSNFTEQMRKVFPDRKLEQLPMTHEVFSTFFDIDAVMQIPNRSNGCWGGRTWEQPDDINPRVLGISDDNGRLMVGVTYNSDLGDAWEYMDLACYPEKYSGFAYRMGLNFMIYAMSH